MQSRAQCAAQLACCGRLKLACKRITNKQCPQAVELAVASQQGLSRKTSNVCSNSKVRRFGRACCKTGVTRHVVGQPRTLAAVPV